MNTSLTKTKPERREFRMDPALLWSVIERQAGSAEKALLEAVMNAVDAGATQCDIILTESGYTVHDNGGGFKSREDIEMFFETFGTPHKDGDAVYGTYRMGRGQLFAFSKTRWETGSFIMDVDIKNNGLEYDLHTDAPHKAGCAIHGTWYEPIPSADVIKIDFELRKLAHWIQIPVFVNKKQISKNPANEEWTYETDDAYIRLKSSGGLAVYNLGALVKVFSEREYGTGGIIVTKKQLKVNFARNDILTNHCNVWKRIRVQLDKDIGLLAKKRKTLAPYEMQALANRFAKGEIPYEDIRKINLLDDVSGKSRSLNELSGAKKLCIVPDRRGWTRGERVMNQKLAFVLRSSAVHQFGVDTAEEFLDLLNTRLRTTPEEEAVQKACRAELNGIQNRKRELERLDLKVNGVFLSNPNHPQHEEYNTLTHLCCKAQEELDDAEQAFARARTFNHIQVVTLEEVSQHITDQYDYVDDKDLPTHQKAVLEGLREVAVSLHRQDMGDFFARMTHEERLAYWESKKGISHEEEVQQDARRVIAGNSDVALAWTDGKTYTAVDQKVIRDLLLGKYSISFMVSLMVHEHSHDEPDQGGHVHSSEFYKRFHDLMVLPERCEILRYAMVTAYAKAIASLGKKPSRIFMQEIRRNNTKMGETLSDMNAYVDSDCGQQPNFLED